MFKIIAPVGPGRPGSSFVDQEVDLDVDELSVVDLD
jgi:hypothetical protein